MVDGGAGVKPRIIPWWWILMYSPINEYSLPQSREYHALVALDRAGFYGHSANHPAC